MIRTVIVDDELNSQEVLATLIGEYCPQLEIIAKFKDPREARVFILENDFDLLFLDINMPFMNGMELLKSIPTRNFKTIFTTAFDSYAIDAIRLGATDYLLKPIDHKELLNALKLLNFDAKAPAKEEENMSTFTSLVVDDGKNSLSILSTDLVYVSNVNNQTKVRTSSGNYLQSINSIKYFEDQLQSKKFVRCHKSYLINTNFIKTFVPHTNQVIMSDDAIVPVSNNKKQALIDLME